MYIYIIQISKNHWIRSIFFINIVFVTNYVLCGMCEKVNRRIIDMGVEV